MKATMLSLAASSLGPLLVAGACATWYFTLPVDAAGYELDGAGWMMSCLGLPVLLLGMALAASASILAAVSASQQSRRAWRLVAITSLLIGGAGPIVLLVGTIVASVNAPPEAVVNSPPVVKSVYLLAFALPVVMPVVALAYSATMPAPARTPAYGSYPPAPFPYQGGHALYGALTPFPTAPQIQPPSAPPTPGLSASAPSAQSDDSLTNTPD